MKTLLLVLMAMSSGVMASIENDVVREAAERNGIRYKSDSWYLLLAIRKAENGRPGREFGILHPKARDTNLETQTAWAAATIVKNQKRFGTVRVTGKFIVFLGSRYAPIGADNDKGNLNSNWVKNVTKIYERMKHDKE